MFRLVYRSVCSKDVDLFVWEDVATREGEGLISRIDIVWFCNQQKYLWTVWRNFLSKALVELRNLKERNLSYCLISSRLTYYDCISGVTDFLKDTGLITALVTTDTLLDTTLGQALSSLPPLRTVSLPTRHSTYMIFNIQHTQSALAHQSLIRARHERPSNPGPRAPYLLAVRRGKLDICNQHRWLWRT